MSGSRTKPGVFLLVIGPVIVLLLIVGAALAHAATISPNDVQTSPLSRERTGVFHTQHRQNTGPGVI